jgi:hypothetical protein
VIWASGNPSRSSVSISWAVMAMGRPLVGLP